ncbi:MAG: HD domain-containing protein [Clostridium sp.]|nr:HD domain-containing protein [Clostridium sp.]
MSDFEQKLNDCADRLPERIRDRADEIHRSVNQTYGDNHPYVYHLDMVARNVARYADEIGVPDRDIVAVWFGAYFHDTIEDARLTYNNVMAEARRFMDDRAALIATEIAYALTNEKGRTRSERADRRYYAGIRQTPYAPMVKLADRLANLRYSASHADDGRNPAMFAIYRAEMPHFLEEITAGDEAGDPRLRLPQGMIDEIFSILSASENR